MKKEYCSLLVFLFALCGVVFSVPAGIIPPKATAPLAEARYLKRIYPLLPPGQASRELFDSLNFFQAPFPRLPYTVFNPRSNNNLPALGELVCVSWVDCRVNYRSGQAFITGDVAKNEYDPEHLNQYRYIKGFRSYEQVEVYHNQWYSEPGHFYYFFKGTGIFLNLGKTLVATNKIDALKKLGMSDADILNINPSFYLKYGLKYRHHQAVYQHLADYVKHHADVYRVSQARALHDVLQSCVTGSHYNDNRIANSEQLDLVLWKRAKQAGYDTVQLTVQPNDNNGWAFEILDLRNNQHNDLVTQWRNTQRDLSVRNPLDMKQHRPCHYVVPFKKLYCKF